MNTTAVPPSAPHSIDILPFNSILFRAKGWLKFLGILSIIGGALQALSVVGIVIAWLPIWIGVVQVQAAGAVERAQVSGDVGAFTQALDKLRLCFLIQGIMTLVGLILAVLALIFYGAVLAAMLGGAMRL